MLLDPGSYALSTALFVRAVAAVGVIAFLSLMVQLEGLFGRAGILPVSASMARLRARDVAFRHGPTLFWYGSSDRALWAVAAVGLTASLAAVAGLVPAAALLLAWACYLSFSTVGREFLSYQWDALLLETTLVAAVAALHDPPTEPLLLLLWLLAFRFVFQSGTAKLASDDRTWRDLSAVAYHHWTQPLPTRAAWHAHQLPGWVHRATTLAVLVLEVGFPFLLFTPWPWRLAPLVALAVLQVAIAVDGNYGFFNLLSLVLLIPLVPDDAWGWALGALDGGDAGTTAWWVATVAASALLLANAARLAATFVTHRGLRQVLAALAPFRVANRYGLFAVMTTRRPEIVVEGSHDGQRWDAYRFRYKPLELTRPPRWNAPHQPRLDWQLWFAALGSLERNGWFVSFCRRLLEGSRPVIRLLEDGPDPDDPPRFVRARLDAYRFTDRGTRRATGRWWERAAIGSYAPAMTLDGERLRTVGQEPRWTS